MRHRLAIAIVVAAGAILGAGIPVAAVAASPAVEYSRDGGLTWSVTPPPFLFSPSMRLVPGDSATENVLIRSLHPDPMLMQVSIANATTADPLLESALTVRGADAAGAGLVPTTLDALTTCQPIVPDRVLAQGQIVSVSLTLKVSPTLTGQAAQGSKGSFDIALAMSDPGPAIAPNGCAVNSVLIPGTGERQDTTRTTPAGLAYTGATLAYPAIITTLVALAIGGLFVLIGRRRGRESE